MKAWTDYPFTWLGDTAWQKAPVREIEVLSYDDNKYCRIKVGGGEDEIKAGYIYQREGRFGEVPTITKAQLAELGTGPERNRMGYELERGICARKRSTR